MISLDNLGGGVGVWVAVVHPVALAQVHTITQNSKALFRHGDRQ